MRAALLAASLATLTVLTALAGCTGNAPPAAAPEPTSQAPAPAPLPALEAPTIRADLTLGPGDGEPNIAIAPDGTIYVTPVSQLYRSTDGGKTFKDLGTDRTDGHGDGDTLVTPDGTLHWLGLFGRNNEAIPYQRSTDQGDHFSTSVDLSAKGSSPGTGSDREWLALGADGAVGASWRDGDQGGIVAFRVSHDVGLSWDQRRTMMPDALGGPLAGGLAPHEWMEAAVTFGSDATGTGMQGTTSDLMLAHTWDDGQTWNLTHVVTPDQSAQVGLVGFPVSIFPVTAVDANGTVYIAFAADAHATPATTPKPAARSGVYLSVSHDGGRTFTTPKLLSDPAHAALMPAIAAGAAGRIAIAWYENEHGIPSENLPDEWDTKLWESSDADAGAAHAVLAQLNGAPNHIGAVCTGGSGCLVSDRCLLDYFEVALDGQGLPQVAWASCDVGTGVGVAAVATAVHFGGVERGTPLR